MSRIEEAMERAARLRAQETAPAPVPPPAISQERPYRREPVVAKTLPHFASPWLVAANDPQTPAAEEYRKLKSILVRLTKEEQFLNTIMVTSTVGGEGKSITALNLAICLAQEYDHTVLLVDADLRKPSLHSYLGLSAGEGLAECLQGNATVESVVVETGVDTLSLLPAGHPMANPTELFTSQRMQSLIADLKSRYPNRYILFDSPPILPVADSRTLASLVDGVLFVVKEREAPTERIKEAMHLLQGANVMGVVYNNSQSAVYDHGYYYQYYGSGKPRGEEVRQQGLFSRLLNRRAQ